MFEEDKQIPISTTMTFPEEKKEPRSMLRIDGPTAVVVYTTMKYSWFRKIMWKWFFGIEFSRVERKDER